MLRFVLTDSENLKKYLYNVLMWSIFLLKVIRFTCKLLLLQIAI